MEYERLMAALAALDPEFRAVIVLRDVEECDYGQMSAIREVPPGTIKSRKSRPPSGRHSMKGIPPPCAGAFESVS